MTKGLPMLVLALAASAFCAHAETAGEPSPDGGETVFLRFGKPVTQQNPAMPVRKIHQYQDAMSKKDGPKTCAARTADGNIDVRRGFDWAKVENLVDLEICVFFVAAELRNAALMSEFLTASGFGRILARDLVPYEWPWIGETGEGVELTGSIATNRLPDGFNGFLGTILAYSLTVGVTLRGDGYPFDTQAILNVK